MSGTLPLTATAADTGGSGGVLGPVRPPAVSGSGGSYTNIGSAVTLEPYGTSFNTAGVPDGLYEIRALATDLATNTQGNSVTS